MEKTSTRVLLREGTKEVHEQLDALLTEKYFNPSNVLLADQYATLLANYRSIYQSILKLDEESYTDNQFKAHLEACIQNIDQDLNQLGQKADRTKVAANSLEQSDLAGDGDLGVSYVVYGSMMGGKVLAKQLSEAHLPTSFFNSDSIETGKIFKNFLKLLEERTENPENVLKKSVKTFTLFKTNLS